MKISHALTLTAALACAAAASAQNNESLVDIQQDSLMANHKIITFGSGAADVLDNDSVRGLVLNFYYDQFRHLMDPAAPYFLFMSKGADLAMGVGGCVRARGFYDWGGAIPVNGFAPMLIPMNGDKLKERRLGSTPAGTALFFRVIGRNSKWGLYQLYIEANFNGYDTRDFHLEKAYATIEDWTVGYAVSTFSDMAALPPVIDAQGPNVKMSNTAVLLRWMHTWRKRWTVAASVEQPSMAPLASETARERSQYVPNFAAFAQYEWGRSAHVRVAGIMRQLPYRDMLAERNHTQLGWGLQGSTTFHPMRNITVYGAVNGGVGYAGLGGDLLIGSYDLVADPTRPGRAYAPASWGYYASVQYNFKPNLLVSCTFGQARYLPSKPVSPDEYKYGLFGAANVIWNLTPRIMAGIELDYGRRVNFSGAARNAHRLGAMASFSF